MQQGGGGLVAGLRCISLLTNRLNRALELHVCVRVVCVCVRACACVCVCCACMYMCVENVHVDFCELSTY